MIGGYIYRDKTRAELKIIGSKCSWAGHLYEPWTKKWTKTL